MFWIYQFVLTSTFIIGNYYFDEYISKPFDRVDALATGLFAFLIILSISIMNRFYARLAPIRFIHKMLLSISAFIFSVVLLGFLSGLLTFK